MHECTYRSTVRCAGVDKYTSEHVSFCVYVVESACKCVWGAGVCMWLCVLDSLCVCECVYVGVCVCVYECDCMSQSSE